MEHRPATFVGIDFGAKLAGTTAVCFENGGTLRLLQSAKKQDADRWLRQLLAEKKPSAVYLDAPLSLPGAYTGRGSDFHYRHCDRAVGGMSPMFLGGLTARAMQLRAAFPGLAFHEVYPAQLVRLLPQWQAFYKKDLPLFLEKTMERLPLLFEAQPTNWHQADAALAWLSGHRHLSGAAVAYGEDWEGTIRV